MSTHEHEQSPMDPTSDKRRRDHWHRYHHCGAFGTLTAFLLGLAQSKISRATLVANFRSGLGRSILLGLEFLAAADIINTVAVEPTVESLIVLADIVLIRTFLSFSLEVEIDGRWPWQKGLSDKGASDGTDYQR
jgi:uncharacterized membrane protein